MGRIMRCSAGLCALLIGGLLLSSPAVSLADETPMPVLETKTETVAVFKNGLGFFTRQGETLFDKDGWAVAEHVPDASLGTFWLSVKGLEELIALREEREKEIEITAGSMEELLEANNGREVVMTLDGKTLSGKIRLLDENRPVSAIILETAEGKVALRTTQIEEIRFLQPLLNEAVRTGKETIKMLKLRIAGSEAGKEELVSLSYLQKGIGWTPSYIVDISDPEKAKIAMKALLINDVEDIEETDIYFVVGHPNFMYSDIFSPISLNESIRQFFTALTRGGAQMPGGILSNIATQRVSSDLAFASPGREIFDFSTTTETPGAFEEDLFLYQKEGVSLKKGERASYYIFSGEVDYKHTYRLDIPNTLNVDVTGRRQSEIRVEPIVWHSLQLTNSTSYPWTTAPALVVSGNRPLAQDTLYYTSKGNDTNLKITAATDIRADYREFEDARQRDVQIRHDRYDLVTVRGEIPLKNYKNKNVDMDIRKSIIGEVIEAGYDAEITMVAEGITGVNPSSSVRWQILLEAGEEITVYYNYKVYIR